MSADAIAVLLMNLFGGLAFFLFGMKVLSEALQAVAGGSLRHLVYRLTRHRLSGLLVGNLLGFVIHSGAATVLLVGFINAGMMTLAQSLPVVLGANVGTTLAMQIITFKVGRYALGAVAVGVLTRLAAPHRLWRHTGSVLFGFGLLFLGMDTMAGAVMPLKDGGQLASVLAVTQSATPGSFALAMLFSLVLTVVFQSSGATIGVVFALCQAGVFTELRQVFPVILGAHIGTCSATILGSVGTHPEARRSAYAHLAFNVFGAALGIAMLPLYERVVPWLAHDMTRQVANAHTLAQLVPALVVLPATGLLERVVRALTPSKQPPPEPSHLVLAHLDTPETAIADAMLEERRMAAITRTMLVQAMSGLLRRTPKPFLAVVKSEEVVDTIKLQVNAFLAELAKRRLSTRQSILLQYLMSTASDLERIGDHVEDVTQTTTDKVARHIWFDEETMRLLVEQFQRVDKLLRLTILSLDPELRAFKILSERMLTIRREFVKENEVLRGRYRDLLLAHKVTALDGLFHERYLRCFERIVRHAKGIARVEQQDVFVVKPRKFDRRTGLASINPPAGAPLPVNEQMLEETLRFDDLGVDLEALASSGEESRDSELSDAIELGTSPSSRELAAVRPRGGDE